MLDWVRFMIYEGSIKLTESVQRNIAKRILGINKMDLWAIYSQIQSYHPLQIMHIWDGTSFIHSYLRRLLIALPEKVDRKLLVSIPFWYWHGILLLQKQSYRLILCSKAGKMESCISLSIDRIESYISTTHNVSHNASRIMMFTCHMQRYHAIVVEISHRRRIVITNSSIEPSLTLFWSAMCSGSCPLPSGAIIRRRFLACRAYTNSPLINACTCWSKLWISDAKSSSSIASGCEWRVDVE